MFTIPRGAAALVILSMTACTGSQTLRIGPDLFGTAEPVRDTAQSRMNVAAAAEASGRPEIALSMYAAAARQEPRNAEAHARYAVALAKSGNLPGAREALVEPLRRDGDNAVLLRALATIQLQSGKPAEAEMLFARVLSSKPADTRALDGRGVALDMLGRYDEAEKLHRAAQKAEPDNIRVANNLAVSLMLAGHPQEAAAVLEPFGNRSDATERVQTNLALAQTAGRGGAAPGAKALLDSQASHADIDAVVQALGERNSPPAQPIALSQPILPTQSVAPSQTAAASEPIPAAQPITLARSPMIQPAPAPAAVEQAVVRTQEDGSPGTPIVLAPIVLAPVNAASDTAPLPTRASVTASVAIPAAAILPASPADPVGQSGPIVLNPVQPEPETKGAAATFPR